MSREVREFRPFEVGDLNQVLNHALLRFGEDQCAPGGRIEVDDPDDFRRRRVELLWDAENPHSRLQGRLIDGAANMGIDLSALALVVTANTSFLKTAEVVAQFHLSELEHLPRKVILSDPRPTALLAGFHRSTVIAYLLLTENLHPSPLRPWRKGTWLARVTFRLFSHSLASFYRPFPLSDEERLRLGLPKEVVRYLEMGDHDPSRPYNDTTAPKFWVDGQLLALLAAQSSSSLSRTIQVQLLQDFIWGVISSPYVTDTNLNDLAWSDLEDSLLGRIIRFAAGADATPDECTAIMDAVESDPARILARIEDIISLRSTLLKTFEDNSL